jgi:hypoxanthine phosphoribosyltransferase
MKSKPTVDSKSGIKSLPKEYCTWQEVEVLVEKLADNIQRLGKKYDTILAITNGGIVPARLIARELNIDDIQFIPIRNKKLLKNECVPYLKAKNISSLMKFTILVIHFLKYSIHLEDLITISQSL